MATSAAAPRTDTRARKIARTVLALAYLAAGVSHILFPNALLSVTPAWVPSPRIVIAMTGLAEIAGAAGLFVPSLRKAAGAGLALYAVCVFPANIKHAMDYYTEAGWGPGWWYHAPRLVFQPVFVWWALWAGRLIDWPLRRARDTRTPAV
jgi:uncharacterized membrane protein